MSDDKIYVEDRTEEPEEEFDAELDANENGFSSVLSANEFLF